VFVFNAAKGSVRGSLEELRALKELTQLKDLKGNVHKITISTGQSGQLSHLTDFGLLQYLNSIPIKNSCK
jgi:hypothetical protein